MKIANPSENGCKSVFFLPQFHNGEYFVFENILTFAHFLDRGDYMKMRRFFEGPKWVKEKDISYAPLSRYRIQEEDVGVLSRNL